MASDGNQGKIPDTSAAHGSPTTITNASKSGSGNVLPLNGKAAAYGGGATKAAAPTAAAPAKPAAQQAADAQALVDHLNRHLNASGLADQFRLDRGGKMIQQIDPLTGEVVNEFAVSEFPALARGASASGLLVDSLA
jgi:hypothetical protein